MPWGRWATSRLSNAAPRAFIERAGGQRSDSQGGAYMCFFACPRQSLTEIPGLSDYILFESMQTSHVSSNRPDWGTSTVEL